MVSEILVKIVAVILLISVAVVLILGIKTLFKGNEDKKYSNKLMQLRVLLQFIAIIVLVGLAYFFKNLLYSLTILKIVHLKNQLIQLF